MKFLKLNSSKRKSEADQASFKESEEDPAATSDRRFEKIQNWNYDGFRKEIFYIQSQTDTFCNRIFRNRIKFLFLLVDKPLNIFTMIMKETTMNQTKFAFQEALHSSFDAVFANWRFFLPLMIGLSVVSFIMYFAVSLSRLDQIYYQRLQQ